jgi:hypothetical protein
LTAELAARYSRTLLANKTKLGKPAPSSLKSKHQVINKWVRSRLKGQGKQGLGAAKIPGKLKAGGKFGDLEVFCYTNKLFYLSS